MVSIFVFYITQPLKVWQIYLDLPYKNWSNVGKYAGPMECLGFILLHLAWIRNLTSEIQRSLDFRKLIFWGSKKQGPRSPTKKKRLIFSGEESPTMTKTCFCTICFYKEAARTIETTYLRSYGGRLESQWWTFLDVCRSIHGSWPKQNILELFFST